MLTHKNKFILETSYSHVANFLIFHKSRINDYFNKLPKGLKENCSCDFKIIFFKSQLNFYYITFLSALENGYSALVKFLSNYIMEVSYFIFQFASEHGDIEIIKFLIRKNINLTNNKDDAIIKTA